MTAITKLTCPSCAATLTSAHAVPAGKIIHCPKCGTAFAAPTAKQPPSSPKLAHTQPAPSSSPKLQVHTDPGEPHQSRTPLQEPAPREGPPALFWALAGGGVGLMLIAIGVAVVIAVVKGTS